MSCFRGSEHPEDDTEDERGYYRAKAGDEQSLEEMLRQAQSGNKASPVTAYDEEQAEGYDKDSHQKAKGKQPLFSFDLIKDRLKARIIRLFLAVLKAILHKHTLMHSEREMLSEMQFSGKGEVLKNKLHQRRKDLESEALHDRLANILAYKALGRWFPGLNRFLEANLAGLMNDMAKLDVRTRQQLQAVANSPVAASLKSEQLNAMTQQQLEKNQQGSSLVNNLIQAKFADLDSINRANLNGKLSSVEQPLVGFRSLINAVCPYGIVNNCFNGNRDFIGLSSAITPIIAAINYVGQHLGGALSGLGHGVFPASAGIPANRAMANVVLPPAPRATAEPRYNPSSSGNTNHPGNRESPGAREATPSGREGVGGGRFTGVFFGVSETLCRNGMRAETSVAVLFQASQTTVGPRVESAVVTAAYSQRVAFGIGN